MYSNENVHSIADNFTKVETGSFDKFISVKNKQNNNTNISGVLSMEIYA